VGTQYSDKTLGRSVDKVKSLYTGPNIFPASGSGSEDQITKQKHQAETPRTNPPN